MNTFSKLLPIKIHIAWSAVFAGFIISFIVGLLLNLLSTGIGFGILSPESSAAKIGLGATIFLVFNTVVSMYAGGWASGFLSNSAYPLNGLFHGLMTAGFYLFAMIIATSLATTVSLLSGLSDVMFHPLSNTLNQKDAMNLMSTLALTNFFTLLIGTAATAIGGWRGAKRNTQQTI